MYFVELAGNEALPQLGPEGEKVKRPAHQPLSGGPKDPVTKSLLYVPPPRQFLPLPAVAFV